MTTTEIAMTAAMGSAFLFVGFVLAWYGEIRGLSPRPALLVQTIGSMLLMIGLFKSVGWP